MGIMEKAKQFETALITALARVQHGTQQAVDAFAQHATAPGTRQDLRKRLEGRKQVIDPQARNGIIEGLTPGGMLRSGLDQRDRLASGIGFDLPQTRQGLDSRGAPLLPKWRQRLGQDGLVSKQGIRPVQEIGTQFGIDRPAPVAQLLTNRAQHLGAELRVTQLPGRPVDHGKLGIDLLREGQKLITLRQSDMGFLQQAFPGFQMPFQVFGGARLQKQGRTLLDSRQSGIRLPFQPRGLPHSGRSR